MGALFSGVNQQDYGIDRIRRNAAVTWRLATRVTLELLDRANTLTASQRLDPGIVTILLSRFAPGTSSVLNQ